MTYVLAYLLGAIPVGFLVVKLKTGQDLRQLGTGNCGARNVNRALGLVWGVLTMVGDMLKGVAAVHIVATFGSTTTPSLMIAMALAILGHNYSLFLRGAGGKGLATAFGAGVYLNPMVMVIAGLCGLLTLAFSKEAYTAAIAMILCFPIVVFYFYGVGGITLAVLISAIVLSRHWHHVQRT